MGHLNAPLKLARSLSARGHEICYLSGWGYKSYIEEQRLRFVTLCESMAPQDARSAQIVLLERLLEFRSHDRPLDDQLARFVEVLRQEVTSLAETLKPDLFLIDLTYPTSPDSSSARDAICVRQPDIVQPRREDGAAQ